MNVRLWNEELRLCTEILVKSGVQITHTHTGEQVVFIAFVHWLFIDSEL